MNNYFLNSGLLRDDQLNSTPEEIRFLVGYKEGIPNQGALILSFNLILAEQHHNIIQLVTLSDSQNNQLIDIKMKSNILLLQYGTQTLQFNINVCIYKEFPFFIVLHMMDIHFISNFYKQSSKLTNYFAYKGNRIGVKLGDKQKNHFSGVFKNFQIKFIPQEEVNPLCDLECKLQKKFMNEIDNSIKYKCPYIEPLKSIQELVNWKANDDITGVVVLKNIKRKKGTATIVCHDMNNGYKEDIWNFGRNKQFSYRFMYLYHCDIFIYFSHNLITIPTIPYINVCHQFGTKILGTIITENNQDITNQLITFENADRLCLICQHYKFDGYLLNLETNVNPDKCLLFMQYFKEKLEQIGAILIYYDSLNAKGELKWQSSLNIENIKYFNACGYFFSDYHWNQEKLIQTANQKRDKIFMGIDIWGRGQFGGGQLNSYIALQNIKTYNLGVAYFGQAWSYENANNSNSKFLQTDNALWEGKSSIQLFDKHKNQWVIAANGGQGWKIIEQDGEEIAIASFDWCIRTYTIQLSLVSPVQDGILQFSCKVRGTGPKFDDHFLLAIELYDKDNKCIQSIDSLTNKIQSKCISINNFNIADEKWKEHTLSIRTNNQTKYAKIVELGKDSEFWAGNYGAQFTAESIVYICYTPEKDMIKMISPRTVCEFPIQTYFNVAYGNNHYIDGQLQEGAYDNLNDFDYSLQYSTKRISGENLQENWEISQCFSEAWNGSSCIRVKGDLQSQNSFLIKLYKLSITTNGQIQCSINMKHFDKKQVILLFIQILLQLVIKQNDKQKLIFKPNKHLTNKGWDYLQYQITDLPNNINLKSIYLKITNISQVQQSIDGLIGGFTIYDEQYADSIKNIDFKDPTKYIKNIQLKESVTQNLSFHNNVTNQYDLYLLLDLPMNYIKTVRIYKYLKHLILSDKQWIGNTRSNYAFFSGLSLKNNEMYIKLQLILTNGNHIRVESILPIIIYQDQIVKLI